MVMNRRALVIIVTGSLVAAALLAAAALPASMVAFDLDWRVIALGSRCRQPVSG
jgi:hypothetical protein